MSSLLARVRRRPAEPPRGAVVLGASSGVGRAVAMALAEAGHDLVISARSATELEAVASDLQLRHGVRVVVLPIDLLASDEVLERYVEACFTELERPVALIVPAGVVDDDDDGIADWELTERLVVTNFLAVAKVVGRFSSRFEADDGGTVALFSSIAAAAPRRRNVAYAAAKSALESYAASLQHRYAESSVHVQLWKLGYVDTEMARGEDLLLPMASPERVAAAVVRSLHSSYRSGYYPRFWGTMVRGLRSVPWFVYRRLDF